MPTENALRNESPPGKKARPTVGCESPTMLRYDANAKEGTEHNHMRPARGAA